MIKQYNIEKSPLYKLRNRQKLALLLKLPKNYFRTIHRYTYSEFYQDKPNGGKRKINNPEDSLKRIQKKLFNLLNRLEKPEWLISGKKGKSYVDNAKMHQFNSNVCTIDIEKFYDSTREIYVYNFFKNTLMTSSDIAAILTYLLTYEGKIPTGTPTSQLIAFWAYIEIFSRIQKLCEDQDILFSLYVDDITLSSDKIINKTMKYKINSLLHLKNLQIKKSKTKFFSKTSNKSITGVIIDKNNNVRLENSKRKEIINLYRECTNKTTYSIEKLVTLNGKMNDAKQVEPTIFPSFSVYLKKHQDEIKEYNKEKTMEKKYLK